MSDEAGAREAFEGVWRDARQWKTNHQLDEELAWCDVRHRYIRDYTHQRYVWFMSGMELRALKEKHG